MNREKKQMVVLGVLALMIVCVGAFQMMGSSSAPAPAPTEKKEEKVAEKSSTVSEDKPKLANPDQSRPLAKRDPFAPSAFAIAANQDPNYVPPVKANTADSTHSKPIPDVLGKPKRPIDWEVGGVKDGEIGPLEPPAPKFGYTLIGFVQGKYPAAVFADATGNQKLVEAGDPIDGSAKLIAVYGSKVKVKFHDQTLVLTVGGNPNGK